MDLRLCLVVVVLLVATWSGVNGACNDTNCATCAGDEYVCTDCNAGYYVDSDGACEACSLANCTDCSEGYFLKSKTCTACNATCSVCHSASNCTSCKTGLTGTDGKCDTISCGGKNEPCLNGGICNKDDTPKTCSCADGFEGFICETESGSSAVRYALIPTLIMASGTLAWLRLI